MNVLGFAIDRAEACGVVAGALASDLSPAKDVRRRTLSFRRRRMPVRLRMSRTASRKPCRRVRRGRASLSGTPASATQPRRLETHGEPFVEEVVRLSDGKQSGVPREWR